MKVSLGAVVLSLVIAGCGAEADDPSVGVGPPPPSTVRFHTDGGPTDLDVELATTREERAAGLMGVEELPADQGMAFLYGEPTRNGFWMKDTLIPLSIAFVDQDGRVIAVRDMEPCSADPCPLYGAGEPYVLAVEANLGWFDDAGVEVGTRAVLHGALDG